MPRRKDNAAAAPAQSKLFDQINALIHDARARVAITVNRELVLLYWQVGKAIKEDILDNKRADYGEQVIVLLARKLQEQYGKGWSKQQLCIVYAVRRLFQKIKFSTRCVDN